MPWDPYFRYYFHLWQTFLYLRRRTFDIFKSQLQNFCYQAELHATLPHCAQDRKAYFKGGKVEATFRVDITRGLTIRLKKDTHSSAYKILAKQLAIKIDLTLQQSCISLELTNCCKKYQSCLTFLDPQHRPQQHLRHFHDIVKTTAIVTVKKIKMSYP